jgi:hypothetical protein
MFWDKLNSYGISLKGTMVKQTIQIFCRVKPTKAKKCVIKKKTYIYSN